MNQTWDQRDRMERSERREILEGTRVVRFDSVEGFLAENRIPNGRIEIGQNVPIHLSWVYRESAVTLVTFSAAVSNRVETVPVFSGWGLTKGMNVNVLMISDPTLILSRQLTLSWYAGSEEQPDLQMSLTKIIRKLTENTRVFLFGGSGGGYAALEQASRLEGATVVASNPQTDITRYPYFETYLRLAWPGVSSCEELPATISLSVLNHYSASQDTELIYLQNEFDEHHIEQHMKPFLRDFEQSNKAVFLVRDFGQGHVGPVVEDLKSLLQGLFEAGGWSERAKFSNEFAFQKRP